MADRANRTLGAVSLAWAVVNGLTLLVLTGVLLYQRQRYGQMFADFSVQVPAATALVLDTPIGLVLLGSAGVLGLLVAKEFIGRKVDTTAAERPVRRMDGRVCGLCGARGHGADRQARPATEQQPALTRRRGALRSSAMTEQQRQRTQHEQAHGRRLGNSQTHLWVQEHALAAGCAGGVEAPVTGEQSQVA